MASEYGHSQLHKIEAILTGDLDPATLSRGEIQRLVSELQQAHQVELEAQNQELRQTQLALDLSLDKYAELYDFAQVALFTLSREGAILEVNRAGAALLAVERPKLLYQRLARFVQWEDRDALYLHLKRLQQSQALQSLEIRLIRPDSSLRYVQVEASPVLDGTGQVSQFRVAMSDITALKRVQEDLHLSHDELEARLKEKEVLLKEIHHRVKNSLQAVSNLIYLQSDRIKDEKTREMFRETQNRIKSIALIHEKLYTSANLTEISFVEYGESLVKHLVSSYGNSSHLPNTAGAGRAVRVSVQSEEAFVPLETAVTIGIIMNELVSNALKHAFPARPGRPREQANEVTVQLRCPTPSRLVLVVADNGVGLPPEMDVATTPTLGLQLVHTLAGHLYGAVQVDRQNGTTFTVTLEAGA